MPSPSLQIGSPAKILHQAQHGVEPREPSVEQHEQLVGAGARRAQGVEQALAHQVAARFGQQIVVAVEIGVERGQ
ncbi:MAG TPA: hypothetical protein VNH63_04890, partial [Gemmatimonadales bacterium]|nr:hypothetical protein [Gemmatimonadales bacterium]